MSHSEIQITLKCLFCGSNLQGATDANPKSGDMLKCQDCKELNDYDSLVEVAIEEGKEAAIDAIKKQLNGIFK